MVGRRHAWHQAAASFSGYMDSRLKNRHDACRTAWNRQLPGFPELAAGGTPFAWKTKASNSARGARGQTEGDVMNRLFTISTAAFAMSAAMATTAFAVPVTFGTNWLAQAEHGG